MKHSSRRFDVTRAIDDVITLVGPLLGERIHVRRSYPADPVIVRCFPARLHQVFLNVLRNAAQAIQEKGEIHVSVFSDSDRIEIVVTDNGKGIPEEKLARIFDFGFSAKQDGRVGMRLGLPSSKRAVEEIGGVLTIASQAGEGNKGADRVTLRTPRTVTRKARSSADWGCDKSLISLGVSGPHHGTVHPLR